MKDSYNDNFLNKCNKSDEESLNKSSKNICIYFVAMLLFASFLSIFIFK